MTSKKNPLGNLHFALGYLSNYRHYKQIMLENEYNTISEVVPDLTFGQYENLRMMIEIEMMVNAVQYCSELAAFAICTKNKKRGTIIQFLSSLSETAIKDFYSNIGNAHNSKIKAFMGYNEIDIEKDEDKKYLASCERFKTTMGKLGEYYNQWYPLYTSYKHGLRIIPFINDSDGKKGIIEACFDNTTNMYVVPETWSLQATDVTIAINNIYEKLYVPLVRYKFYEAEGLLSNDAPKHIIKTDEEIKEDDYPIKKTFGLTMEWFHGSYKVHKPFY